MRVLVIGGAGYIGSVLVEELLERGYAVKVFDRLFYGQDGLKNCIEKVDLVVGDMRGMKAGVLEGVDAVINVGGLSNDPTAEYNPKANFEMNVAATERTALLCRKAGIRRYIYASSCSIYDYGNVDPGKDIVADEDTPVNPKAAYSFSKRQAELILLKMAGKDFSPVILRKGTVFGFSFRMRYDLVLNTFIKDALSKGMITVFSGGEMWRPLVSIKDAARCYVACLVAPEEKVSGEIFNLVYRNFRISELALRTRDVLQKMGIRVDIVPEYKYRGVRNYRVSGEKIRRVLGVEPVVGIEESVRNMVEMINGHGESDFENPKYYNLRWLKFLEDAEKTIKQTGSILDSPSSMSGEA